VKSSAATLTSRATGPERPSEALGLLLLGERYRIHAIAPAGDVARTGPDRLTDFLGFPRPTRHG
jgi:hypothetical protein